MIKQIVVCDVCGKQKAEVNHWHMVSTAPVHWNIRPWDDAIDPEGLQHICGQECAVKSMSKFMQEYGK